MPTDHTAAGLTDTADPPPWWLTFKTGIVLVKDDLGNYLGDEGDLAQCSGKMRRRLGIALPIATGLHCCGGTLKTALLRRKRARCNRI